MTSKSLLLIQLLCGKFIDTDSVLIVLLCFCARIFLTFEYFIYHGSPHRLINMMTSNNCIEVYLEIHFEFYWHYPCHSCNNL